MVVIQEVCSQVLADDDEVIVMCALTKRDLRAEKSSCQLLRKLLEGATGEESSSLGMGGQ